MYVKVSVYRQIMHKKDDNEQPKKNTKLNFTNIEGIKQLEFNFFDQ